MELKLIRTTLTDQSTIGDLFINGQFECHTLEDVVRPVKIKGMTAIPAGTYEIIINFSQRFQKQLPRLLNVPNFDGVLIHAGNTAADTEGCLLVGQTQSRDMIGSSRAAFDALFPKLQAATATEKIFIEILNPGDVAASSRGASRGASRGGAASAPAGSVRRALTAGAAPQAEPSSKPVVKKAGSRSAGVAPADAPPSPKPVVKKTGTRSAQTTTANGETTPSPKPVVKKTGTRSR